MLFSHHSTIIDIIGRSTSILARLIGCLDESQDSLDIWLRRLKHPYAKDRARLEAKQKKTRTSKVG